MRISLGLPIAIGAMFSGVLALSSPSQAATFSQLYVFGDSLSDPGNFFNLSGGTNALPPYVQGRLSNGPVWSEYLAQSLNLAPAPFTILPLLGGPQAATQGINFAVAGALTDRIAPVPGLGQASDNVIFPGLPGLQSELTTFAQFNAIAPAKPDALYTLWFGANDYLGGGRTSPAIPIDRIGSAITSLYGQGARNFLIPNLPDLGLLPINLGSPTQAAGLNAITQAHNNGLTALLPSLLSQLPGSQITLLDVNQLFRDVTTTPAAFGFTNIQTPCFASATAVANNCAGDLFADAIHPTTAAHQLIAARAIALLDRQSVAEPNGWIGVMAIAGVAHLANARKQEGRRTFS
jgi:cholinesterase